MKTILFLSTIFCVFASPALGELTPSDLEKIRLIVKEEVKTEINAIKAELQADIKVLKEDTQKQMSKLEADLKTYIDTKIEGVETKIGNVETKVESLDKRMLLKFESLDERILLIVTFVSGLMILIVVTVGIPQVIMAWRDRKDQTLEKKVETMAEELEKLKQQHTVSS